jgi:hypothetical protein
MKATLVYEEHVGGVKTKVAASLSGGFSHQEADAFLIAALTAIESRSMPHDPQANFPARIREKGFLHDGQSGVEK